MTCTLLLLDILSCCLPCRKLHLVFYSKFLACIGDYRRSHFEAKDGLFVKFELPSTWLKRIRTIVLVYDLGLVLLKDMLVTAVCFYLQSNVCDTMIIYCMYLFCEGIYKLDACT